MYVNETIRNESKTCRKIKGGTFEISIISAANCHRILNLEPNLCSDIVHLLKIIRLQRSGIDTIKYHT